MKALRWLFLLATFFLSLSLILNAVFSIAKDGNYTEELIKESYNSGSLVDVIDVRDDLVSLSMDNEKVLMKEGESYSIKNKKSKYSGSVKILKIDDDKVSFEVSAEKTLHYYLINIFLSALLSLGFTSIVGRIFSKFFREKTTQDPKVD